MVKNTSQALFHFSCPVKASAWPSLLEFVQVSRQFMLIYLNTCNDGGDSPFNQNMEV